MQNRGIGMQSGTIRRYIAVCAIGALALAPLAGLSPASAAVTQTAVLNTTPTWSHTENDSNQPVWFGSPGVATLGGRLAVVLGTEQGAIYAYNVDDGSTVPGWPAKVADPIFSTPASGTVNGSTEVFVGVGTSAAPRKGGYLALTETGKQAWYSTPDGDMSSMAFGPIQTQADVVGASMSQHQYAINAATGHTLKGFPWFEADTNFSSPALANLGGDGHDEIIEGGDSTHGLAHNYTYTNGGHIRILSHTGMSGHQYPTQALQCQYNTTQVVQSSPAVGGFLKGGKTGIVVGTGDFYKNASDNDKVIAVNTACHKVWSRTLGGSSHPSPALADVNGDGTLDVIANSNAGDVWALNGADGSVIWKTQVPKTTYGGATTFQVPGQNYQDVLIASTHGLYVLDGRNGDILQQLAGNVAMRNSATVTADPDGSIGVTIAGIVSGSRTQIEHFVVAGSSGVTTVQTTGAWPMFHHDPQLTGSTLAIPVPPTVGPLRPRPTGVVPPAGSRTGPVLPGPIRPVAR